MDTQTLLAQLADVDHRLDTPGAVADHERDGLLLQRRALQARLDAAQLREAQRPQLRLIRGGWDRTLGLDVA